MKSVRCKVNWVEILRLLLQFKHRLVVLYFERDNEGRECDHPSGVWWKSVFQSRCGADPGAGSDLDVAVKVSLPRNITLSPQIFSSSFSKHLTGNMIKTVSLQPFSQKHFCPLSFNCCLNSIYILPGSPPQCPGTRPRPPSPWRCCGPSLHPSLPCRGLPLRWGPSGLRRSTR